MEKHRHTQPTGPAPPPFLSLLLLQNLLLLPTRSAPTQAPFDSRTLGTSNGARLGSRQDAAASLQTRGGVKLNVGPYASGGTRRLEILMGVSEIWGLSAFAQPGPLQLSRCRCRCRGDGRTAEAHLAGELKLCLLSILFELGVNGCALHCICILCWREGVLVPRSRLQ